MSFQAPFDTMEYARLRMTAEQQQQQQQQAQQQQYMGQIFGALGDIAQIYQQNEEMEAGVKAGEMFGKTFGKQFGLDPSIFSSPEYKGMPTSAKYQLHQGIRSNFGSLSQSYNFGQRVGVQQAAPAFRAQANAASQVAAGQGRMTAPPANINYDAIP